MAAIDIHTHAFPDEIAARAMAKLEAGCPWKAFGDGTVAGLLKSMDLADIDISVICTIATKPDQVGGIVKWCLKVAADRIVTLPSVHPDAPDAAQWCERIADEGFPGIKLHPMYQQFAADEPRMDAIYDACRRHDLFVVSHCGYDIAYPPDDTRGAPARFAAVLKRHKGLKLVCTHMGGWRAWDESAQSIIGSDAYVETSMSLTDLPRDKAVAMISAHDPSRMMFGTDWPWQPQKESVKAIERLGLSKEQTRAVLYGNAAKLLGL
jgi:predicted TIM-barrel fold metal-dependent hydrolase